MPLPRTPHVLTHRLARGLCVVLLLAVGSVRAELTEDAQTWLSLTAFGRLGGHDSAWLYLLDLQARLDDNSSRFGVGIARPAVGHLLTPTTSAWLGYAHVISNPESFGGNIIEHRVWQQLSWVALRPVAGMLLSWRGRLEERSQENGKEIGWRARPLVKLIVPLHAHSAWSLVALDEVSINLNGTGWGAADGFDQNVAFAGVGVDVNTHLRAELGYLNQYAARDEAVDSMNHAVSLNVLLNF